MTKKKILSAGFLTLFLVITAAFVQDWSYGCYKVFWWCQSFFGELLTLFMLSLLPFVVALFFSFLTYWTKEEVFRAWWNPAIRFWIPAIIFATLITTWLDSGSGAMSVVDISIGTPILGLLYTLFIVTSLVKIVKTYLKTRGR